MKNILKKVSSIFAPVMVEQTNIIQQIHDEFDFAEERLMQQADKLLKELNISTFGSIERSADLHTKLGFVNSKIVEHHAKTKAAIVVTTELANLIGYYKQNYPFQKFLTENELNRICEKYNLIYAPVGNYKENVPEKNLIEISNAKTLEHRYTPEPVRTAQVSFTGYSINPPKEMKLFFARPITINESLMHEYEFRHGGYRACRALGYNGPEPEYKSGIEVKVYSHDKSGLFIAAPKTHFDLTGVNMKSKFGYAAESSYVIKDPIVFRYCKGGIQVLSKWGLEASDENLVNEKLN